MHIPNTSILENQDTELAAKLLYFYLCFAKEHHETDRFCVNIETISSHLGMSKNRIYRARKILCSIGAIQHDSLYCVKTGKKAFDQYKLI